MEVNDTMSNIEAYNLPELINIQIREDEFAADDLKRGKNLHMHDGIWWTEKVKFYYGPLNKMKICETGKVSPAFLKAPLGYGFRVSAANFNGYNLTYNILEGENLKNYDLNKITSPKKSQVKQGLNNCKVRVIKDIIPYLPEMKAININQALRFDKLGAKKDYLPASYYQTNEEKWKQDMLSIFSHVGHFMIGAFVDNKLAAFIDLIIIDDLWEFGAVKSHDEFLPFRPVDALYYHILHTASLNLHCRYVINGGGENERESLTKYKSKFLLYPTVVHYCTRSVIPGKLITLLKQLIK